MKRCTKCKVEKPLDQFYRCQENKSTGRVSACKVCTRIYATSDRAKALASARCRNPSSSVRRKMREYGNRPDVKRRRAERNRLKLYGLTDNEFRSLWLDQLGACAICSSPLDEEESRAVMVDHDHKSKKVRGLLCDNCNRGLGFFKDKPAWLRSAATYLENYQRKE
jgi:hypothetical protein